MDDFRLEQTFDWVTRGGWTWFVTLKYPLEGSPKHTGWRASNAEDAFSSWICEMVDPHERDGFDSYMRVIEQRENGDTLFHVLLRTYPCNWFLKKWRWRWFQISGGSSWERPLDTKIVGLFRYFFYKVHCDIEYNIAGESALLRAAEYQRE